MLHSHKLKGELAGAWACTVDYDKRILFEFSQKPESGEEEILLLTMGTHDEVY
jgi:mRNA-degrading endonuclease YafQ of YafQ-DinJ toxin-antitoxin module